MSNKVITWMEMGAGDVDSDDLEKKDEIHENDFGDMKTQVMVQDMECDISYGSAMPLTPRMMA